MSFKVASKVMDMREPLSVRRARETAAPRLSEQPTDDQLRGGRFFARLPLFDPGVVASGGKRRTPAERQGQPRQRGEPPSSVSSSVRTTFASGAV